MKVLRAFLALVNLWTVTASQLDARVVRLDLERQEDVLEGKAFGQAGAYEKLVGKVHFAVHPENRFNRTIVDIDEATTDADGEVTFAADFFVLRPKNPAKGNGSLFMEIPNRGGKGMLTLLNSARGSFDPTEPEHFGDGFLLRRGFTLVWLGWQFDTRIQEGRMRLYPPVAEGKQGLVRSDFVVPEPTTVQSIGHVIAGRIGGTEYAVADAESRHNVLTVRERPNALRETIPRGAWRWVKNSEPEGDPITGIELGTGFEPGKIYELVYEAADPALVGLGLAAVRDFASYAKHEPKSLVPAERTIVFGISQSGRFLRHLLYQGFNADEEGRQAFDGVMAHVAGAGRGSFNHRFAQPSRDGQPMEAIHYPTDLYPFTDLPLPDQKTLRVEGLLDRPGRDGVVPKIFHTNTSYEYWGRAGSLIHTTPDGRGDAKLPDSVRIYHLAGVQHFQRPLPPSRVPTPHILGRYVMNPNPSSFTLRALVVAMQDWVHGRGEPPASRYPRLDEGTLVPFEAVKEKFPAVPNVLTPRDIHLAYRMDYGPDWHSQGIISEHPPKLGEPFPAFVPDIDEDGNERGGIRIPQLEVPVATYTAWNLRDPSIGAASERVSFLGSYFPFPRSPEDQEATEDPRRSLAERYNSFEDYLGRYTEAALELVEQRFLLADDLGEVLARGRDEWYYAQEGIEQPLLQRSLTHLASYHHPGRFRYGAEPLQFGELRLPPGPGPHPVAIMIHGGCWLGQYDMEHVGGLAQALTAEGLATWTVEYRRVGNPGGGWPGTFEDVAAGTDHLRLLAGDHPLDLQRVVAIGHSAGGQLALWLASRKHLREGDPLFEPDPLPVSGVLGLAAAADLAHLHEIKVCGHVVDSLMGGGPTEFPERYRAGSPPELPPMAVPQILINGLRDPFWSSVAKRYLEAALKAGAEARLIEAPESGHFEMIDPGSTTWPLVRDAARELVGLD